DRAARAIELEVGHGEVFEHVGRARGVRDCRPHGTGPDEENAHRGHGRPDRRRAPAGVGHSSTSATGRRSNRDPGETDPSRDTTYGSSRPMITVTRRNGSAFALNPDLIERIDATPDTVITLVDGAEYVVQESVGEVVARVRESKAAIVALSHLLEHPS